MNRKEFMDELKEHLVGVSKVDRDEIIEDYEEHFKIGKREKRSEKDIVESLGDPRQIAKDARGELSGSNKGELKDEAVDTWVAVKKLSRQVWGRVKEITEIEKVRYPRGEFTNEGWIFLILLLLSIITDHSLFILGTVAVVIYSALKYSNRKDGARNKKAKGTKKKSKGKTNSVRFVISLLFNLLFFFWVWFSVFWVIIGLFIGSIAILISGVVVLGFAIFSLFGYHTVMMGSMIFSGLFAGIGLILLGGLLTDLSEKVMRLFFWATKKYIELNMRFIEE